MAGFKVRIELVSDNVTTDLKRVKKQMDGAIGIAMMRVGTEFQGKARGFSPYKTGTLRRGINFEAKERSVEVGVNTSIIPYARIREFGGTILPRNEEFLVFQVNGRWVKTRKVVQRASNGGRGYLRPAFAYMKAGRAFNIIKEEINSVIK